MEQLGVLYYVDAFPKLSESFILNEANELYNRAHNIAALAQNDPEETATPEEYEDVDVLVYDTDAPHTDFPKFLKNLLK